MPPPEEGGVEEAHSLDLALILEHKAARVRAGSKHHREQTSLWRSPAPLPCCLGSVHPPPLPLPNPTHRWAWAAAATARP